MDNQFRSSKIVFLFLNYVDELSVHLYISTPTPKTVHINRVQWSIEIQKRDCGMLQTLQKLR